MFGIAGIATDEAAGNIAELACEFGERIRHRGPDDHGWLFVTANCVQLGQGRPPSGAGGRPLLVDALRLFQGTWRPVRVRPNGRCRYRARRAPANHDCHQCPPASRL